MIIFVLCCVALVLAVVAVVAMCKAASKPTPIPSDKDVIELENHLMRKALLRGSK